MNLTSNYSTEKIELLLEESLMKVICHSRSFEDCRTEVVILVSWACMTSTDIGPLIFYDGGVNARSYVQLIGDALPACINSRFGTSPGGFWYMQDNARPHVSSFAKKFFKRNEIPLLEWPPTSPDLNPIENLWDMIDNQLRTMHPKNLMKLKQMIEQI